MTEPAVVDAPRVTRKTFSYRTSIQWLGGRVGVLASKEKTPLRVSSPPEFKGDGRLWSPEDLLVGALNACMMATFVALAERGDLPFRGYTSEAEGTLEFVDGGYRMTRVTVRPWVLVSDVTAGEAVRKTLEEAHRKCIVSNSIRAEVRFEPTVEVGADR